MLDKYLIVFLKCSIKEHQKYILMLIQDAAIRPVTKNRKSYIVRDLKVEDKTGVMNVTLWDEKAQSPIKTGEKFRMTHMSPKKDEYHGGIKLASTGFSHIEVCCKLGTKSIHILNNITTICN